MQCECKEKERINKLYKVMFEGNGTPPLTVLMERLTNSVESLNKNQKRIVNTRRWVVGTVISIAVLLIAIASFAFSILNHIT